MYDIMLFGRGYSGEIWRVDSQSRVLELFERPDMQSLGENCDTKLPAPVTFTVSMQLIQGRNYFIAFADEKPSNDEIEWTFLHSDRKPESIIN